MTFPWPWPFYPRLFLLCRSTLNGIFHALVPWVKTISFWRSNHLEFVKGFNLCRNNPCGLKALAANLPATVTVTSQGSLHCCCKVTKQRQKLQQLQQKSFQKGLQYTKFQLINQESQKLKYPQKKKQNREYENIKYMWPCNVMQACDVLYKRKYFVRKALGYSGQAE